MIDVDVDVDVDKIDWEPYKQDVKLPFLIKIKEKTATSHSILKRLEKKDENMVNKTNITVKELLYQYYNFKREYMKLNKCHPILDTSKINKKYLCVRCNKSGGNIFTVKNGKYHTKCGNALCCFEYIFAVPNEILSMEDDLQSQKQLEIIRRENIIKQKMDTLFGYKELHISVKEFKKQLNGIIEEDVKLDEAKNIYQNVSENEKDINLIETKHIHIKTELNHLLQLYSCENNQNTEEIVTINNRITKLYLELRKLNYTFIEMQEVYDSTNDIYILKLVKKRNTLRDLQLTHTIPIEKYYIKNLNNKIDSCYSEIMENSIK